MLIGTMTLDDAPNGKVSFELPSESTAPYVGEFHVWYFELWLHETNGIDTRLDSGKWDVELTQSVGTRWGSARVRAGLRRGH